MSETDHIERLKKALTAIKTLKARVEELEQATPQTEPIAIIGLGCRYPGANNPAELWQLLCAGTDAISEVPPGRWDIDEFYDPNPQAAGKMLTRYGGFIEGVEQFDPHFFGISPREAVNLDPQQRLLLEVVWEALEQAGYAPDHLGRSLTGVFMGLAAHDYTDLLLEGGLENINAFMGAGNAHSVAVGRVSFLLGLQGPCVALDTACSSSLVAIHLACQSLHLRECDLALAGGVNLLLTPTISVNHSRAQMLAPDGRCKTFSAAADGFSRADGCGVVVLKRLSEAVRDGDFIWATINGSAVNHDGRTTGLTVPSGPSQQAVVRQALQRARLEPAQMSYIEAHGTGTSLGDPIEIGALGAVFAPGRPANQPLYVGSIKTNIGHAETAAGVAGVIKTALALHHQLLPAHLHFDQPNPLINWQQLPFVVPTQATPWAGPERYAGVSSFGFGGTNAHLVLASAPAVEPAALPAETRPLYLLPLSAKSEQALNELRQQFQAVLPDQPSLADVCFTAGRGRGHYNHRLAVSGRSAAEMAHKLAEGQFIQAVCTPSNPPRVAFLFTGQGAQYPEMAQELYATEPTFRAAVDHCLTLCQQFNAPVIPHLHSFFARNSELSTRNSFNHTSFVQPALFIVEYALAQLWRSWGIEPAVLLGHSVGEVAAACVAGVFSLADGLRLIVARGQLMGNLPENGDMVAVLAPEEKVHQLLQPFRHVVDIAAVNGPNNVVISGEKTAVAQLVSQFQSQNISCTPLSVSHAFHSPLMDAILEPFAQVAAGLTYHLPEVDLVSNVTGRVETTLFTQPSYWVQHIRQPVRFAAGMQHLHSLNIEHFLEIGPKPTLLSLGRRCLPEGYGRWWPSLRPGVPDQEQMFSSLAELYTQGAPVNWANLYTHQPARRLPLPTTPFERQRYWVKPPAVPTNTVPAGVFYQLTWRLAPPLPTTPPIRQRFWLLPDQGGVISALAQELQQQGHEVVVGETPVVCDHLVYGRVLDWSAEVELSISHSEQLLHFVQQWLTHQPTGRLWLLTQQSQRVDPAERTLHLTQTLAWGLGKVFALEHPERWGGLIDLPAEPTIIPQLAHHLTTPHQEDLAAMRPSGRFVLRLTPQELSRPAAPMPLDPEGSYLITGGLGALGLQVARWLTKQGARHLVLTGRNGLTRPEQEQAVSQLQKLGATVHIAAVDVANRPQMAQLLAHLPRPLRGVVHAAGVPGSDKLTEITAENWQAVLRPKLLGGWYLHELTAGYDLQFFINFSSIASAWGSKGQAHYAAANQFLDGLSQLQQMENRPGLALNWGPWAGGGMATAEAQEWLAKSGVQALNPAANLAVMGAAWQLGVAQGVVAQVDWAQFKPLFEARLTRPLLAELVVAEKPAAVAENRPGASQTNLAQLLAGAKNEQEQYQRLMVYVQEVVAAVLGFAEGQKPEVRQGFFEMGLDSLLAVELKNRLAQELVLSLPTNIVFDYPTIHGLATYLQQQYQPAVVVAKRPASGGADPAGLLAQVLALTEPEVEAALTEELAALEQVL